MKEYNFEEKSEYDSYKGIGSSKVYKNYCTWEETIIKKYKSTENIQFLINFKAYLNKICNQYEKRREAMTSLWIPFLTLIITFSLIIPSIFLGIMQYQDSFKSDINNTYLQNMVTNGSSTVEVIDKQVEFFNERLKDSQVTLDFIMVALYLIYGIIIIGGIILGYVMYIRINKISFYKDYVNVINKLIDEKSKINN